MHKNTHYNRQRKHQSEAGQRRSPVFMKGNFNQFEGANIMKY